MIQHKANALDIRSLSLIGCGNLLFFREAGTTVTVKWETPPPDDPNAAVATFATTTLDGRILTQATTWKGVEMLCRMGWRLSTPGIDWETVKAEWQTGLGLPCEPWQADYLLLTAEPGKAP